MSVDIESVSDDPRSIAAVLNSQNYSLTVAQINNALAKVCKDVEAHTQQELLKRARRSRNKQVANG